MIATDLLPPRTLQIHIIRVFFAESPQRDRRLRAGEFISLAFAGNAKCSATLRSFRNLSRCPNWFLSMCTAHKPFSRPMAASKFTDVRIPDLTGTCFVLSTLAKMSSQCFVDEISFSRPPISCWLSCGPSICCASFIRSRAAH